MTENCQLSAGGKRANSHCCQADLPENERFKIDQDWGGTNQGKETNKKGPFWLILFICSLPNKSWSVGYLKFSQTFLASYFLNNAHFNTWGNSELRVCLILKYQFCHLGKSREILCQCKKIVHPWVGFNVIFSAPGRCSRHLSICVISYVYWLVLGNVWQLHIHV